MTWSCTRRLQFCAGHRVMGHENKCAHLHGHNYVVFITAIADDLDSVGRVIDFSVIKAKVGGWIDEHWDHGLVLCSNDNSALQAQAKFAELEGIDQKVYTMLSNPTAENMAEHLLVDICPTLFAGTGCKVSKVLLWETENCYSEVSL